MKRMLLILGMSLIVIIGTACAPSVSEDDLDDIRQAIRNDRHSMIAIIEWVQKIDARLEAINGGEKNDPPPPPCIECWP